MKETYPHNNIPQENTQTKQSKRQKYYLGKQHPNQYLTRREAECMILLIAGNTNVETATKLNLSPRTIEYYLKNIREKLGCYNKPHLIRVITQSDFLSVIDFELET